MRAPGRKLTWRAVWRHLRDFSGRRPQGPAPWVCALIVIATIWVPGCHGVSPDELDFTRAEPRRANLVGRWVLTSDSLQETKPATAPTPELDLREDGSFSAVHLPTAPQVAGAKPQELSGSGTWHVDKDLDGVTIWVINLDFQNHHRETVHLRHQTAPYMIHVFLGDPDSGRVALLRRVS
jgi:hypothetical protein